ncbi:MAG: IMP dehydrogenase [Mycoplasmatales bacterium]
MNNKFVKEGYTYDDVLIIPSYSTVLPKDVNTSSFLTKNIKLNVPIMSAAMDTVTESNMAICMALNGGIGVIHKNLTIKEQSLQVKKVKNFLKKNKKDISHYDQISYASDNTLLSAAAIGVTQDVLKRVDALIKAGVDVLVLDSAHGDSKGIVDIIKDIKKQYPKINLIAGNICTGKAAIKLKNAGVDAVKVGIGPGSICTTRIISGVGRPQVTAIDEVVNALKGSKVKVIADGGIKYSGDIAKALSVGADIVMLGSVLAGTKEAPGNIITLKGNKYKSYVGMGSIEAMKRGSKDRYFQGETKGKKLISEGISGVIPYKGSVEEVMLQMIGGLRSSMGYTGSKDINTLMNAKLQVISSSTIKENHPHSITIVGNQPNYRGEN